MAALLITSCVTLDKPHFPYLKSERLSLLHRVDREIQWHQNQKHNLENKSPMQMHDNIVAIFI